MGLFDTVSVNDARFACTEGHGLDTFQTKDLGATGGDVRITGDLLEFEPAGNAPDHEGRAPLLQLVPSITIYTTCRECPAYVDDGTWNVIARWVELEIELGALVTEPGVITVWNDDGPVFQSQGVYWRAHGGTWYQSSVPSGGWTPGSNTPAWVWRIGRRIDAIRSIGPSLADYLADTRETSPHCEGPMSWNQAVERMLERRGQR